MKTRMTFVAVAVLWAVCGPVWAVEDMISYWRFDEGSGATAYDSIGINDGTIHGATWTTGQISGALSFDGVDDYVEVNDDPSLRFSQYDSFSVSFWAKPIWGRYVFSKLQAHSQGGLFGYALRWTGPSKFQFMTQKSRVATVFVDTTDNSAPAGSWYYVTAVYDNKDMKIYLNAELKGTNFFNYDTGSTTPDNNFTIGVRLYDSTLEQYFGGIIDDVMIFNEALSSEEIQELYLNGFSHSEYAIIQIIEAITEKIEALERIDAALEKEWAAYEALEELLESGDYGDLKKGDIIQAMQKVHSAIQHDELSKKTLERSIEKLEDALSALGYEPKPPPPP